MRAPPLSLSPMIGAPTFIAMSIIFTILFANISPRLPPNTLKSWENTNTRRPSIVPYPVTTPSPGIFFFSMSKSVVRWTTNRSVSTNEPGSSRMSSRSRAVPFPRLRCASIRSGPPPNRASAFLRRSSWTFGSSATPRAKRGIPLTLSCGRVRCRDGLGFWCVFRENFCQVPSRHSAQETQDNRDEREEDDDEPPPCSKDGTEEDEGLLHGRDDGEDEEPEEPRRRRRLDAADRALASSPRQEPHDGGRHHGELPHSRGEEDQREHEPEEHRPPPGLPQRRDHITPSGGSGSIRGAPRGARRPSDRRCPGRTSRAKGEADPRSAGSAGSRSVHQGR